MGRRVADVLFRLFPLALVFAIIPFCEPWHQTILMWTAPVAYCVGMLFAVWLKSRNRPN